MSEPASPSAANPTGDPLIAQAEAQDSSRAADLFDVRRFIAALLGVYGVILTVLGVGASDADIAKAADVNVNLWTGIALILVAIAFVVWALVRPLSGESEDDA